MSYDVSLFVPFGTAPLEDQVDDDSAFEENDADRARLAAMRSALLERDPAAKLDESHGNEIIVTGSERLPYMEIGSRRARIAMSMGTDSHDLYRVLYQWVPVFAQNGYAAFDHQQGSIVKPADDFRTFMHQFRDQWNGDAAFEAWLATDHDAPSAPPQAAAPVAGTSVLGIVFGVLILLWALYKLHKAGYF